MTNTTTLPEPEFSENLRSFKGKAVALRHAKEYAGLNGHTGDTEPEVGEVFAARYWNGGYFTPVWLQYTVSATDEGWTISAHRWFTNPEVQ